MNLKDDFWLDDILLYGLKTLPMQEYKLVYLLNKALGYRFRRGKDLDVLKNGKIYCHSVYEYESEEIEMTLIYNLSHPQKVAPEKGTLSLFDELEEQRPLIERHSKISCFLKINSDFTLNTLPLARLKYVSSIKKIDDLKTKEKKYLL